MTDEIRTYSFREMLPNTRIRSRFPPPSHSECTSQPDNSSFSKCFMSSPLSKLQIWSSKPFAFFCQCMSTKRWRITETRHRHYRILIKDLYRQQKKMSKSNPGFRTICRSVVKENATINVLHKGERKGVTVVCWNVDRRTFWGITIQALLVLLPRTIGWPFAGWMQR